jgi:hypothetical protein
MRENLTYGSRWQGMETWTYSRYSSKAPFPDPTSRRCSAALRNGAEPDRWVPLICVDLKLAWATGRMRTRSAKLIPCGKRQVREFHAR